MTAIAEPVGLRLLRACGDNRELHLILLPTEACNFRCTYCYEDFKLKRMQPEVVRGVERWLTRRAADLHALNITWFGGEPLLAPDIVRRVLQHVRSQVRAHPRLAFQSDMTTNGYRLDPETFVELIDLGVTHYQISFDGPREWHDRKRVLANGRGTFDRIWGNLLATRAVEREFLIVVRVHVDAENQHAIPRFIQDYNRLFADDPRYQLFLRKLECFGGPNDATLPVLNAAAGTRVIAELEQQCRERREEHHVQPSSSVCYAARANSYVVRADGRLNKCTIALNHPANQVGTLHEDGHVRVSTDSMKVWMRGLRNADLAELECPMEGLDEAAALAV